MAVFGKLGGYATTDERRGTREGRVEEAAKAKPRIGKQARRHPAGLDCPESRVAIVLSGGCALSYSYFCPAIVATESKVQAWKGYQEEG